MFCLQKSNKTLLVATQSPGNKINAKKPQHVFIHCEQNVEEYYNLKVSNTPFFVSKIKTTNIYNTIILSVVFRV